MNIADINPHIRFAGQITYVAKNVHVYVKDCRLFYILNGNGKIHINNSQLAFQKDTVFYCAQGSDYTIEADNPIKLFSLNFDLSQKYNNLTIGYTPEIFNKTKIHTPIDNRIVSDSFFLNSFLIFENGINFKKVFSEITDEFSTQQNYFREKCSSILKELLIELHRININTSDDSYNTVKRITDYIDSNFRKEIKNIDLANLAGYHEYYLNRLFVKHTGLSMHKYILNLRITESKHLLLNTNMSISDIAFQVGFNSYTHFVTYFKKETTMTPFKYRNNYKNSI